MSAFPVTVPAAPVPGARSRWLHWAPALLLVVDLTVETTVSDAVAAGFLLTLLPVVTAFTLGPLVVGGATALALGLQLALADRVGHLTEQHHVWVYVATVLAGVLGAALAAQRRRQSRDLVRVRTIAETLQRAVLRPVPGRTGALRAAGFYHPAEADAGVGGDLYEVCETRFGTRVLLGDVRGKGLAAVRTVADVLGAFRTAAHETPELGDLAAQLDRQVARHAAETGDHELFVTAVLVEHQPATGRLSVVNRGHLDPLLLRGSGVEPVACPGGLPLGLGALAGRGADASQAAVRELHPGETLLLVTDGITEARDKAGTFYPLAARLETLDPRDPRAVIDHLGRDVPAYAQELSDDLTALALAPVFGPEALLVETDEARLGARGGAGAVGHGDLHGRARSPNAPARPSPRRRAEARTAAGDRSARRRQLQRGDDLGTRGRAGGATHHPPVPVEDEHGGRAHHLDAADQVEPLLGVDLDVPDTGRPGGDVGEQTAGARAGGAQGRGELDERRPVPEGLPQLTRGQSQARVAAAGAQPAVATGADQPEHAREGEHHDGDDQSGQVAHRAACPSRARPRTASR